MWYGLIIDIVIAVLAVFGVWCLLRLTAESLAAPDNYAIAVICDDETDTYDVGCVLRYSKTVWHTGGTKKTIVLLKDSVVLTPDTENVLRDGNVEIYRIREYINGETGNEEN